jgi:endonuclease III-like uncharacterized protein
MEEFTLEELEKIINKGNFDSLVGERENDFFECKSQSYNLTDDYSKRELAKDVSSFANLKGGYILIGIKTKRSLTHFSEEVERVRPIDKKLVNVEQYNSVINDWIYPKVDGVEIKWFPLKENDKGILIIKIPLQKENKKPFLIKKIVEEGKNTEIIFGYCQRKQDKSEPLKIEDIHRIVKDGLFYDKKIETHFNIVETLIQSIHSFFKSEREEKQMDEELNIITERVNSILELFPIRRSIILIAYPKERVGELKSLFVDKEGSIKRKLEDPPLNAGKIREGGWSLETLDRGKIIEGKFIRVRSGDTKIIDLYNDGVLIFLGSADENFLAWASKDGLMINSIALIELVYNFLSFYREVLNDFTVKPRNISVRFGFLRMHLDGKKTYLIEGRSETFGALLKPHYEAPKDNGFLELPINFEARDFETNKIEESSYKVVEKIYSWFGVPLNEGNIPYTKIENSIKNIDIEQIKKK